MSEMNAERVAHWKERYDRAWAEAEYPYGARMTVTRAEWQELRVGSTEVTKDPLMAGALADWVGVRVFVEDDVKGSRATGLKRWDW